MVSLRFAITGTLLLGLTISSLLASDVTDRGLDSSGDPVARFALDYTYERAARVIGRPAVIISMPVTVDQLHAIDIQPSTGHGSQSQLYLVVLQCDFDVAGMAPGWGRFTGT